jgi:hypothetical protein
MGEIHSHDRSTALLQDIRKNAPSEEGQKQCTVLLDQLSAASAEEERQKTISSYVACMRDVGASDGLTIMRSRESVEEELDERRKRRSLLAREFEEQECGAFGFIFPAPR